MKESGDQLQQIIDTIPTLAWSARPDGPADFFNRRWLDYTGLRAEQARGWGWKLAIHPEDLPRVMEMFYEALKVGQPFEVEGRLRGRDGDFRWFLFRGSPLRDGSGKVAKWYGTNTELEDRKRAEEVLRAATLERARLALVRAEIAMTLARKDSLRGILHTCAETMVRHLDAAFARIWTLERDGWELELQASAGVYTRLDGHYSRIPVGELKIGLIAQERKPHLSNDVQNDPRVSDHIWASTEKMASFAGYPLVVEDRLVGVMGMFSRKALTQSTLDALALIADAIAQGIERKRTEEALRAREQSFRLIVNSIPGLVYTLAPSGELEFVNQQVLEYFGKTFDELRSWPSPNVVCIDDLPNVIGTLRASIESGQPTDVELRLRRADGLYRWFLLRRLPQRNGDGRIVRWYSLITDIEERKAAEEKLRRSESDLLEAQRLARAGSWKHDISSGRVTVSPEIHRMFASSPDEDTSSPEFWFSRIHPEDRKRTQDVLEKSEIEKTDYQGDYRIVLPDGTIKYQHSLGRPVLNESGQLVEFIGTAMDVTEQVQARTALEKAFAEIGALKDQLYKENIALREEISQASMFEEIIGSSEALRRALIEVAKVAPTDSTVMIFGETGTGKELVARAIQRRSKRSGRAFIRVNCAAIPPSLIASELFGHERGAFTGALQRRAGRFECADGGTIFLDEIGELSLETQVSLLRVLQEREFERVGSSRPISIDVRVLAATNRDLEAAVVAGTFRQDLFYRLNVFPVRVPALRERKDDIPVLVEYLVERYAKKAGKSISLIKKKTLDLFQAYDWPGNIRELQNVVERAVILCDGETFSVDATWLQRKPSPLSQRPVSPGAVLAEDKKEFAERERKAIEAALAECEGRVAGSRGAAAKLGIPRQTAEWKIASLGIDKRRFKVQSPSG
jgi:PAS domain S-box-containing protein